MNDNDFSAISMFQLLLYHKCYLKDCVAFIPFSQYRVMDLLNI